MNVKTDILTGTNSTNSLGSPDKRWLVNGKPVKDILEISISLSSQNGTSKTINNSAITAKHVVLDSVIDEAVGYIIG